MLLVFLSTSYFGKKLEPKERITRPDHTIFSRSMGKYYQLYISFPKSYLTKDTISYLVVYVLDGKRTFSLINESKGLLNLSETEVKEVIIVGIGSGLKHLSWIINRTNDYAVCIDNSYNKYLDKRFDLTKGTSKTRGVDMFLECIKTEIISFIDKRYKMNTDRGISGHSFRALSTA